MAGEDTSSGSVRKLDQTPKWAVASICAVFIIISILLEKFLHKFGTWLRYKNALFEALEKVKAELIVLGFLSLLLTFGQTYIVKICIPASAAETMLPCPYDGQSDQTSSRRKLLWNDRRFLATESSSNCKSGYEPIISINGLHQLHILIFFLAIFHVIFSAITMMLGRLKVV